MVNILGRHACSVKFAMQNDRAKDPELECLQQNNCNPLGILYTEMAVTLSSLLALKGLERRGSIHSVNCELFGSKM